MGADIIPFRAQVIGLLIVLTLAFVIFAGCIEQGSSENSLPVPKIEISDPFPNQNEVINFSALDSYDDDGVIVSYFWDFGDGSTSTKPEGVHSYKEFGVFGVTLIVTDNGDAKAIANKTVKVNALPIAKLSVDLPVAKVYQSILFTGSGSYDPDGGISKYMWDFGDSSVSTSTDPRHTYNEVGTFSVTLTVYDDGNAYDAVKIDVEIFPRSYLITWERKNETQTFNDLTMEGSTTNKTHSLSQVNLLKVEVILEWDDDFPFTIIENESVPDPDTMELYVESPEGSKRKDNSTSGKITLHFLIGTMPNAFQLIAKDEVEASMVAEQKEPEDDTETGTWLMSVTAQDCPGSILKNGVLEIDPGNSWKITFNYYYYEMVITEEE
jgi:PKD repeat protein